MANDQQDILAASVDAEKAVGTPTVIARGGNRPARGPEDRGRGAGFAAECMRRGLIDEFELFVVPIVVGDEQRWE